MAEIVICKIEQVLTEVLVFQNNQSIANEDQAIS